MATTKINKSWIEMYVPGKSIIDISWGTKSSKTGVAKGGQWFVEEICFCHKPLTLEMEEDYVDDDSRLDWDTFKVQRSLIKSFVPIRKQSAGPEIMVLMKVDYEADEYQKKQRRKGTPEKIKKVKAVGNNRNRKRTFAEFEKENDDDVTASESPIFHSKRRRTIVTKSTVFIGNQTLEQTDSDRGKETKVKKKR